MILPDREIAGQAHFECAQANAMILKEPPCRPFVEPGGNREVMLCRLELELWQLVFCGLRLV
jgi:hypothetical protein